MGGRLTREGIHVYLQLIHAVVQQKLTQHCKAIILQLKKKKKRKNEWRVVKKGRKEGERERTSWIFSLQFLIFFKSKMCSSQEHYVPWADQYSLSITLQDIAVGHRN